MCEPKPEKNIIQLMGKEDKKQARTTHRAIKTAFNRNGKKK